MKIFENIQEISPPLAETTEKGLRARYETVALTKPEEVFLITPKMPEMAVRGNQHNGVSQHLRTIIKDGEDFFALVDVMAVNRDADNTITSINEGTFVTRKLPNRHAEPIGSVDPGVMINVGADSRTGEESGDRFSIALAADGSIKFINHGASPVIELFVPKTNSRQTEHERLLHADTTDPVDDPSFWSVDFLDSRNLA